MQPATYADAGNESSTINISQSDKGYSLTAQQASLPDILHKLGETAHFKLKLFEEPDDTPHDWNFQAMPLPRLLDNLTRGYSTVLLYEEQHKHNTVSNDRIIKEMWLIAREDNADHNAAANINIDIQPERKDAALNEPRELTAEQQYEISFIDNLEGMHSGDIIDTLQQTITTESDPLVRQRAVAALGEIGGIGVLDALESGMADKSAEVRTQLASTLSGIKHQRSMLLLGQMLMGDHDSKVRQQAVRALYQQKTPAARSFVETAAKDKDPVVKKIAAEILQQWEPAADQQ